MVEVEIHLSDRPTREIRELWAYVIVSPDGTEGVLRNLTLYGTQPWVSDSRAFLESIKPRALTSAAGMPGKVKLIGFTRSTVEDVV